MMRYNKKSKKHIHRRRNKSLSILELIAIALGGMIGGGIFTVLGVSVSMIGVYTPIAFIIGGCLAILAAYSYVKLSNYYKDEGATYSFYKRTYSGSLFSASLVGWWVTFGYISTLALYAYTFSSYAISAFEFSQSDVIRKSVAGLVILFFTLVNIWSVKGMGKLEDLMVYTKLIILVIISFVLINHSNTTITVLLENNGEFSILSIFIVASLTFVAFEGFQLVINAIDETDNPDRNIPLSIYTAVILAIIIYALIAFGAILSISFENIIQNKEYALASGADKVLGHWGTDLVIFGAILATSSAISGTLFGASRLMSVIAKDGYFPKILAKRNKRHIPVNAILTMSVLAFTLILIGDLQVILEFSSVTFLLVSLLMAVANYKMHKETSSSRLVTIIAICGLALGTVLIIYYEATTQIEQVVFICGLYTVLTLFAWLFSHMHRKVLLSSQS